MSQRVRQVVWLAILLGLCVIPSAYDMLVSSINSEFRQTVHIIQRPLKLLGAPNRGGLQNPLDRTGGKQRGQEATRERCEVRRL